MSFPTPDGVILKLWGEPAIHYSVSGYETLVKVVRSEDKTEAAPPVLLILFGTMAESDFAEFPQKNDHVEFDGARYKVYDVKKDRPGGSADTDGIWLHLTFDE